MASRAPRGMVGDQMLPEVHLPRRRTVRKARSLTGRHQRQALGAGPRPSADPDDRGPDCSRVQVRGIDPKYRCACHQARANRRDHPVELTQMRESDVEILSSRRRNAMHVVVPYDGQQGMLRAPARLEQPREIRPRPHLRAHPRVPASACASHSDTADRSPLRRAVPRRSGPRPWSHQGLRPQHQNPLSSTSPSALPRPGKLAHKGRQVHSWFWPSPSSLRVCSSARAHGTMDDGPRHPCTSRRVSHFHHVRGL